MQWSTKLRWARRTLSALLMCASFALVALWVRSYSARDMAHGIVGGNAVHITSLKGELAIAIEDWPYPRFNGFVESKTDRENMRFVFRDVVGTRPFSAWGFRWLFAPNLMVLVVPYRFIVAISIALVLAPCFRWHFSIRTLLVAVTLVAVVLAIITALFR